MNENQNFTPNSDNGVQQNGQNQQYQQSYGGQYQNGAYNQGYPNYTAQYQNYNQQPYYAVDPGKSLAIGSIICSIIGFFSSIILLIVGLVLGLNSKSKSRAAGFEPNGCASAGVIISVIGIILHILVVIATIVLICVAIQNGWFEDIENNFGKQLRELLKDININVY